MLSKIALTLVVIVIAVLVIKQRKDAESAGAGPKARGTAAEASAENGMAGDLRLGAYLFLILMFGAGAIIYYQRWQDDHTVLSINLFRDGQSQPVTYQVYKFELNSRSFTTLEGVRITVADSERMEVTGLE